MIKSKPFDVTIHTIVKNEDRFISFALASVLPYVSCAIIYDTGSQDKTVSLIKKQLEAAKTINSDLKIIFKEININKAEDMAKLRLRQIAETKTEWFMLLDGDEIWPNSELLKLLHLIKELPKDKIAIVNKTKNCVGDVWHYASDDLGKYQLLKCKGHLNIRLMRKLDYKIRGIYPNEAYEYKGGRINDLDEKLVYCDVWYLHATHLIRSSIYQNVYGRRKMIYNRGIELDKSQLPEVLQGASNDILKRRSKTYVIKAYLYDLARKFKA